LISTHAFSIESGPRPTPHFPSPFLIAPPSPSSPSKLCAPLSLTSTFTTDDQDVLSQIHFIGFSPFISCLGRSQSYHSGGNRCRSFPNLYLASGYDRGLEIYYHFVTFRSQFKYEYRHHRNYQYRLHHRKFFRLDHTTSFALFRYLLLRIRSNWCYRFSRLDHSFPHSIPHRHHRSSGKC